MTLSEKLYFYSIASLFIFLNFRYTVVTGLQHDYHAVVLMSKDIISGKNPWELHSNFYGPVLWAISSLAYFHELLPKIINFTMWNLTLLIIFYKIKRSFFFKVINFLLIQFSKFLG